MGNMARSIERRLVSCAPGQGLGKGCNCKLNRGLPLKRETNAKVFNFSRFVSPRWDVLR